MNLVQNLYDAFFSSRINSDAPTTEEKNTQPMKEEITLHHKTPFAEELKLLENKYGYFEELTISLQDILLLLPRRRERVDAYRGLVSYAAKKGKTIIIKSRKTK